MSYLYIYIYMAHDRHRKSTAMQHGAAATAIPCCRTGSARRVRATSQPTPQPHKGLSNGTLERRYSRIMLSTPQNMTPYLGHEG